MAADVQIVFWGHACFGIHVDSQPFLLIDPFDPAGLGNIPGPPAINIRYPYVIATHDHSDHAAFHTQPDAVRLHAPYMDDAHRLTIDARTVAHDEFGGRLRGGTTQIFSITLREQRIVHCGDLGERLVGEALAWLRTPTPDVLILPAGGYFTLGADGASALAADIMPRHVLFCHTRDDGLPLPQLRSRDVIAKRVSAWPQRHLASLPLSKKANNECRPVVVWLERPQR